MVFDSFTQQKKFEEWAFGKTGIRYDYSTMLTWNSRHGDKYFISKTETVQSTMKKLKEIYELENG